MMKLDIGVLALGTGVPDADGVMWWATGLQGWDSPAVQFIVKTVLYVAMGWVALLAALPLMAHVPAVSAAWLVIGGAAYTAGVVFFVMDAVVRYAHAVWHGCVVAGTGCHVIAVLGLQTVT